MSHSYSLSIVCLADDRDAINRLACALGLGRYDFDTGAPAPVVNVALSADGQHPASHYGTHGRATPGLIADIKMAGAGALPSINWTLFGLAERRVEALLEDVVIRFVEAPAPAVPSWEQALIDAGKLQRCAGDPVGL